MEAANQSASWLSMAARIRRFIGGTSPSGKLGLRTMSEKVSRVLGRSSLRQVADQFQELLPQMALKSPPMESKNWAISWADLLLVPREINCMVRLPRPLVLASSAVRPPRE